ncbi:MAG: protein-glutamate methylesterase/protein-glutamine glutaminase [Armatimonadota bacterium]
MAEHSVRVLVIDDSSFMRRALARLISAGRGLEVVDTASSGREALERIKALQPDVVTLDIEMPEMDGLQALEAIMARHPVPVVMFSALSNHGAEVTLRCLELGAVDFICKPNFGNINEDLASVRYIIWQKLRSAAGAHVRSTPIVLPHVRSARRSPTQRQTASRVVAIGASTGGPRALIEVLEQLPVSLPAGVAIVQHMPPYFTAAMAQRFNDSCPLSVREAEEGDLLEEGLALVAPGGTHLRITGERRIHLDDSPPMWGVRPAVDPMMEDLAELYGPACLGVILTGMGRDGTNGLTRIRLSGGQTIAQDEATSVVYGMPRSAVEAGVIDRIFPLPEIAHEITEWCVNQTMNRLREVVL